MQRTVEEAFSLDLGTMGANAKLTLILLVLRHQVYYGSRVCFYPTKAERLVLVKL